MTAEVSRDEFEDYRKAHHEQMGTLTRLLGEIQIKSTQTYDMLAGTFERPGMVHRLAAVEAAQAKLERVTPEEQRALWWKERGTKVIDAVVTLLVIGILVMAAKAFIIDTVKDLSAVHAPQGTMIPVERDPSTRFALNQEF